MCMCGGGTEIQYGSRWIYPLLDTEQRVDQGASLAMQTTPPAGVG